MKNINNKPVAYAVQETDRIVIFTEEDSRLGKRQSVPLYLPDLIKLLKSEPNTTWYFDILGESNTSTFALLPGDHRCDLEITYDDMYYAIYGREEKCEENKDFNSNRQMEMGEFYKKPIDYQVKDDDKFMMIITKERIFTVYRRGRNINKYGVQCCLNSDHIEEYNRDLTQNGIDYKLGIVKEICPDLYKKWANKCKEIHMQGQDN